MKRRQKLLTCARGSRVALVVVPFMLVFVVYGVSYFKLPLPNILFLLAMCIWSLFMVINRRLDAMMELLEDDKIIGDGIRNDDAA